MPRRGTRRRVPLPPSPALEDGLALLRERPRALLGVVAGEHLPADGVLVTHRLLVGEMLGLAPRPQDGLGGHRATLGDLVGDAPGHGEGLSLIHISEPT